MEKNSLFVNMYYYCYKLLLYSIICFVLYHKCWALKKNLSRYFFKKSSSGYKHTGNNTKKRKSINSWNRCLYLHVHNKNIFFYHHKNVLDTDKPFVDINNSCFD